MKYEVKVIVSLLQSL